MVVIFREQKALHRLEMKKETASEFLPADLQKTSTLHELHFHLQRGSRVGPIQELSEHDSQFACNSGQSKRIRDSANEFSTSRRLINSWATTCQAQSKIPCFAKR